MKNTLLTIGAIALLVVVYFIGVGNSLVDKREEVRTQWAQVEDTLQRRNDLIPNLVETVKGYAAHEKEVFAEIAEARSKLAGSITSGDVDQISEANVSLNSALGRLLSITESYPELKANEQYTALMDELAGTENRISVARQHYNDKVGEYNSLVQRFPSSVVAGMKGFGL